jgi:hypothetical protein
VSLSISDQVPTLPDQHEQPESSSSFPSESADGSERLNASVAPRVARVSLDAVSALFVASGDLKATDLDDSLMRLSIDTGKSFSMRSLAKLVSERDEHDRMDGQPRNMGLLFTDAAHTVLE